MKYRQLSKLHYKAPVLGLFLHHADTGTFNRNRTHFIAGVDYEELGPDVIRTELQEGIFSKSEHAKP